MHNYLNLSHFLTRERLHVLGPLLELHKNHVVLSTGWYFLCYGHGLLLLILFASRDVVVVVEGSVTAEGVRKYIFLDKA